MRIDKLQVVEWSPSQKCFHVQTVGGMILDNVRVFKGQCMTDYLPIGIFQTEAELERFLNEAYKVVGLKRFPE